MLGMFGFIKKELDSQGKLPAKYKYSNAIYDIEENLVKEDILNQYMYYWLMNPPSKKISLNLNKNIEILVKFQASNSIGTAGIEITQGSDRIAIVAAKASNNPCFKSIVNTTNRNETLIEYRNKTLWTKMLWDSSTLNWKSYYAIGEEPSWIHHWTFAANEMQNPEHIKILADTPINAIRSSIRILEDGIPVFDGSK